MARQRLGRGSGRGLAWALAGLGSVLAVLVLGVAAFWGDLVSSALDPQVPFQTYTPPKSPDYATAAAWHLRPATPARGGEADVFFIPPTTYDGGANWNARLNSTRTNRQFEMVMAPNYVGPFVSVGRVFAPRYRQASLYSLTTLREDAREARRFAYGDIREAFRRYLARDNGGRPFLLVGVEQGGTLGWRLLADEIAPYPAIRARLVGAWLIETVTPADNPPVPPCATREQPGCLAAWADVRDGAIDDGRRMLDRALVWGASGELVNLAPRAALCFNPILGTVTDAAAPARQHLGAANATGLEWGARPAFMTRQVSARCEGGLLKVSRPRSASLQQRGGWIDRRKVPGFNLFYADIEADAKRRLAAWRRSSP
jgi:hypothetical protein